MATPALLPSVVFVASLLLFLRGNAARSVLHVGLEEATDLRNEVKAMFYHSYDNYMEHAFPLDELRPMSCSGEDSLGGYSLTLVDALDSLALMGNYSEFKKAVKWVEANIDFDKNKTVSVFETNIRIMGGLLSAHLLASDPDTGMQIEGYNGTLLHLAEDLGRRMLPAFDTPTGIPYGSVNLRYGVLPDETKVTSTAGGGTLALEFGILSRLTGNPAYEEAARNAALGLWAQRSALGLVGAHIHVFTGEWTQKDAGIGTSIDSFYEYLLKAHILLGDEEYLHIFKGAYEAALQYLHHEPWYVEVHMYNGAVVWPLFNSLQAFWPGLQVLLGDIDRAIKTHRAFFSVWSRFGFTPEGFNLASSSIQAGQRAYPLRPELAESTYWLYRATRDPWYLSVGRDMVASLSLTRCKCGYCHVADVETHQLEDHMESFFLSETVKYLYLLFDLAVGGDNLVENGPYEYVFSTEGHLFPMTPQISLHSDRCSYPGSFCEQTDRKGRGRNSGKKGEEMPEEVETKGEETSGGEGKGSGSGSSGKGEELRRTEKGRQLREGVDELVIPVGSRTVARGEELEEVTGTEQKAGTAEGGVDGEVERLTEGKDGCMDVQIMGEALGVEEGNREIGKSAESENSMQVVTGERAAQSEGEERRNLNKLYEKLSPSQGRTVGEERKHSVEHFLLPVGKTEGVEGAGLQTVESTEDVKRQWEKLTQEREKMDDKEAEDDDALSSLKGACPALSFWQQLGVHAVADPVSAKRQQQQQQARLQRQVLEHLRAQQQQVQLAGALRLVSVGGRLLLVSDAEDIGTGGGGDGSRVEGEGSREGIFLDEGEKERKEDNAALTVSMQEEDR